MTHDINVAKPLGNWIVCAPLKPKQKQGSLVIPKDLEDKTVSEGVAEVVRVGPGIWLGDLEEYLDHGLRPGDKIIYRGFLRFAYQVGDLFGGANIRDYFLLDAKDALAKIEGTGGSIGLYDEFEV